jgi:hypothetical protein
LNCNSIVDLTDLLFAYNNSSDFVSIKQPWFELKLYYKWEAEEIQPLCFLVFWFNSYSD